MLEKLVKKQKLVVIGKVIEILPGYTFRVELENGNEITATLGGKMRLRRIRVVMGDDVQVELSPYDLTKGRIIYRGRPKNESETISES